jgi:hypothetical protein
MLARGQEDSGNTGIAVSVSKRSNHFVGVIRQFMQASKPRLFAGASRTPRLCWSYAFVPPPAVGKIGILLFHHAAWRHDYFIMHDRSLATRKKV